MNIVSKYKLINNYLDQLSNQTACTIVELKLLQRHINNIKAALAGETERIRLSPESLAVNSISNDSMPQQATDLIRIKEVMKMVGLSKSSIYAFISSDLPLTM